MLGFDTGENWPAVDHDAVGRLTLPLREPPLKKKDEDEDEEEKYTPVSVETRYFV